MNETSDEGWMSSLLDPIPGSEPTGSSLRGTSVFYALKERRREELSKEFGEGIEDGDLPDWTRISDDAEELLIEQSKDLEIAIWLTEAWIRLHSFAGLHRGLLLIRQLQEAYWKELHPQANEDDPEDFGQRAGILRFLGHAHFLYGVRSAALTAKGGTGGPYSWLDRDRMSRSTGSTAEFDQAAHTSSPAAMAAIALDVQRGFEEVLELEALVKERYPDDELSFRSLRLTLEACLAPISAFLPEAEPEPPEGDPEGDGRETDPVPEGPDGKGMGGSGTRGAGYVDVPPGPDLRVMLEQQQTYGSEALIQAARALSSEGRKEEALSLLQAAIHRAVNGRERFLRLLELVEFCIGLNLPHLIWPLVDDLETIEQSKSLREWEHPDVFARLNEALISARLATRPSPINEQAQSIFEALCRSDIVRAFRHFHTLHQKEDS